MNNKGFTLVEVLAVVVLLSIIMGIATLGVTNTINNSRLKSEEIFVDKIDSLIEDYIDYVNLNKGGFSIDSNQDSMSFDKCYGYGSRGQCKEETTINAYLMKKKDGYNITLNDLVEANLINEGDLINPRTKKLCGSDGLEDLSNTIIYLFKDDDAVYYYFVDLEDSCEVEKRENEDGSYNYVNIINILPDSLIESNSEQLISIFGEKYSSYFNNEWDEIYDEEDYDNS